MNSIERDSRNEPSLEEAGGRDPNYFAFFDKPTPENLAANRSGILSPQQQEALGGIIANQKHTAAIFGSMSVFAILLLCFFFWKIDARDGVISFNAQLINVGVAILLFGIFFNFIIGDWYLLFAGDELTNGVVESGAGKNEWNGKRYQMRTDSRLLRSLRFRRAVLPPGTYRFYYLPRTGLVVMAEELETKASEDLALALLHALASANHFSLDDLTQNRDGLLGKGQENRLLGFLLFYGVIFLGGLVLSVSMMAQIPESRSTTTVIMVLVIGAFIVLRFGWAALHIARDLWHGKVGQIEGPVTRKTRRSRYHLSYYYVVDSHEFSVTAAAYQALMEGSAYRIYYVQHSKRLVSIEPVQVAGQ